MQKRVVQNIERFKQDINIEELKAFVATIKNDKQKALAFLKKYGYIDENNNLSKIYS